MSKKDRELQILYLTLCSSLRNKILHQIVTVRNCTTSCNQWISSTPHHWQDQMATVRISRQWDNTVWAVNQAQIMINSRTEIKLISLITMCLLVGSHLRKSSSTIQSLLRKTKEHLITGLSLQRRAIKMFPNSSRLLLNSWTKIFKGFQTTTRLKITCSHTLRVKFSKATCMIKIWGLPWVTQTAMMT